MKAILTENLEVSGEVITPATDVTSSGFNPLLFICLGVIVISVISLIVLSVKSKGNKKFNRKTTPKTASQQEKAKNKQQERELKKKNREAAENAARRKATGEPVELRDINLEDEESRIQKGKERLLAKERKELEREQEQMQLNEYLEEDNETYAESFDIFDELSSDTDTNDLQSNELNDSTDQIILEEFTDTTNELDELELGINPNDLDELELEPEIEQDNSDMLESEINLDNSDALELIDDLEMDFKEENSNSNSKILLTEDDSSLELIEESQEDPLEEVHDFEITEDNTVSDKDLEDLDNDILCTAEDDIEQDIEKEDFRLLMITGKADEISALPEELEPLLHSEHYTLLGTSLYRVNNNRVEYLEHLEANDTIELLCPVVLADTKEYYTSGNILNFPEDIKSDISLVRGQGSIQGLKIKFKIPIDMPNVDGISVALSFDTKDFTNNRVGLFCDICIINK